MELFFVEEDIEEIRERGRTLGTTMSTLPNVAAVLRSQIELKIGTPIFDWFGPPYNGYFQGKFRSFPQQITSTTS